MGNLFSSNTTATPTAAVTGSQAGALAGTSSTPTSVSPITGINAGVLAGTSTSPTDTNRQVKILNYMAQLNKDNPTGSAYSLMATLLGK